MKKWILIFVILGVARISLAQQIESTHSKWILSASISPDDFRYPQANYSRPYYQLAVDRQVGKYLLLGVYIGHQNRKSSFTSRYPIDPYTVKEIDYERVYTPVGIRLGFDLTSFFSNELLWIKDQDKWGIQLVGYAGLTSRSFTILTPIQVGEAVEWSNFEPDDDIQYIGGVTAVIRYFPRKNWGIFTELGYGPLGRYSFGASYRIF
jgi:hypothetical protein